MLSIEDTIGFLLIRSARGMKKVLESRLLNEVGITAAQHTVLSTLAMNDGLSLSEIGKRVYLDKPAITGLADRLEHDGLVERQRSNDDRRVIQLFLTSKGSNLLDTINMILQEVETTFSSILSTNEIDMLRDILDRLWLHSLNQNDNEI